MAKFKAKTPFYKVRISDKKTVEFDYFAEYETTDESEIKALMKSVPDFINCVETGEVKPKIEEQKAEAKTQSKPTKAKAASAKK